MERAESSSTVRRLLTGTQQSGISSDAMRRARWKREKQRETGDEGRAYGLADKYERTARGVDLTGVLEVDELTFFSSRCR